MRLHTSYHPILTLGSAPVPGGRAHRLDSLLSCKHSGMHRQQYRQVLEGSCLLGWLPSVRKPQSTLRCCAAAACSAALQLLLLHAAAAAAPMVGCRLVLPGPVFCMCHGCVFILHVPRLCAHSAFASAVCFC
jgi:hypothetical protein